MAQREATRRVELGDLREVELGTRQRVAERVMGRRGGQAEPFAGAPEPQRSRSELLTSARQQAALQVQGAHHPERGWLLTDGAERGAQEGEVEGDVVCQQRPALESDPQLGQRLGQRYAVCQVVVGQPVDGDRVARAAVVADDQSSRPTQRDPGTVHRHEPHRQHPLPLGRETGGLQVDGQ